MKVRIECTYQTPKGIAAAFTSEEMDASNALFIVEDIKKTGRMKNIIFVDSLEHTWSLKELRKQMEEIQTEPHDITVYFDGGFERETRYSGLGCAIYYQQNNTFYRLRKNALVEELYTNNEAEYAALHLALVELEGLGVHHLPVSFYGDSQVVVNQLMGEWPCYEEELIKWADRIENKLNQLGVSPEYKHISRKKNREADRLATQALQGMEITSSKELSE
ncbi:ribonuclease H family protein [Oceanobacillus timonensis]|uniref:ribonuclease H family protein n=1 Tax=Oceanobacillus timonensis TaxID=1926285 RepID=UPI0009BA3961|nr:ribonuclease H family protein [Oceanobacillus timonensis]